MARLLLPRLLVRRRRPDPRTAGFSLIEAIVAATVLALALTALSNAQMSTIRGVENSQEGLQGRNLAALVADDIALVQRDRDQPFIGFGCANAVTPYGDIEGCALPNGSGYTADAPCSRYFFPDQLPNLNGASLGMGPGSGLLFNQGITVGPQPGSFRVDVYTSDHPDPQIPPGRAAVVDVFVCYDDPFAAGKVREIRETRILFAERAPI